MTMLLETICFQKVKATFWQYCTGYSVVIDEIKILIGMSNYKYFDIFYTRQSVVVRLADYHAL